MCGSAAQKRNYMDLTKNVNYFVAIREIDSAHYAEALTKYLEIPQPLSQRTEGST